MVHPFGFTHHIVDLVHCRLHACQAVHFWQVFASRILQHLRWVMYENQELDPYQPPSPASGFLQLILGVILLLLVVVGLVAGWGTFLRAAPILVQVLVILVAIAAPAAIIGNGAKIAYLWLLQIERSRIATRTARVEAQMREE